MYLSNFGCIMFSKALLKICITTSVLLGASFSFAANAYTLTEKVATKHFALYEVILGKGEVYDSSLKNIIANDVARKGKYQATAAIFDTGSKGLSGTIADPMLGVITAENYSQNASSNITFDDNAKHATYAGIYLTFKQFSTLADNKNLSQLISELVSFPLVISQVPLEMVSKNYRGELFYTTDSRALIFDFAPIDSVYYTKAQMAKVKKDCKVNLLAIADRTVNRLPFFISAHGAVNDILCN